MSVEVIKRKSHVTIANDKLRIAVEGRTLEEAIEHYGEARLCLEVETRKTRHDIYLDGTKVGAITGLSAALRRAGAIA